MWTNRYLASSRERTSPLDRYDGDDAVAEILRFTGDPETARQIKREMVATGRAHPDAVVNGFPLAGRTAATLSDLAWIELAEGRVAAARRDAEEALTLRRNLGHHYGIGHALLAVGGVAFHEGDYALALEHFREAAATYESVAETDSLECRLLITECELLLGRHDEARALIREAFPAVTELSDATMEVLALRVVGMLAAASGQAEICAALFGASDRMLEDSEVRVFTDYEQAVHHSYLGRARDALEEMVFEAAYERGHEAPRDEVVLLALSALE
jgi:tetratricopeptide (TPR) repeat protein